MKNLQRYLRRRTKRENTVTETDRWIYSDFSIKCLVPGHELSKYTEGVYIELRTGETVVVEPVLEKTGQDSWTMANALQLPFKLESLTIMHQAENIRRDIILVLFEGDRVCPVPKQSLEGEPRILSSGPELKFKYKLETTDKVAHWMEILVDSEKSPEVADDALKEYFSERLRTVEDGDIYGGIAALEDAVCFTPPGHATRISWLWMLEDLLDDCVQNDKPISTLGKLITVQEQIIQHTLHSNESPTIWLVKLGISLGNRFEKVGKMEDLNRAISLQESVVQSTPEYHPALPNRLEILGNSLSARFSRLGNLKDLSRAIHLQENVVQSTPKDHSDHSNRLDNLGSSLFMRFNRLGNLNDLNRAITLQEKAVQLTPEDNPDLPSWLNNLCRSLRTQFNKLGNLEDLNRAITLSENAVKLTPEDHPALPSRLDNLGSSLSTQFSRLGKLEDLNRAITLQEKAVQATSNNNPDLPSYLNNLSNSLSTRFKRLGTLEDLDRAITLQEKVVQSTPEDDLALSTRLGNLGNILSMRFNRLGNLEDLNRAIALQEKAIHSTPEDSPDLLSKLNNLGSFLRTQFSRLGNLEDLNRAITLQKKIVQFTPEDHPALPTRLNTLGSSLSTLFNRLGNLEDLNTAITLQEKAVQSASDDNLNLSSFLNNLGSSLCTRFKRLGNLEDLNRAITLQEKAVQSSPEDHPNRPSWLHNLSNSLSIRFIRLGNLEDLNRAITLQEKTVQSTPENHPALPNRLDILGHFLNIRYERLGNLEDLNRAITLQENVVKSTPESHPNFPFYLNSLGKSLHNQFDKLGNLEDLNREITLQEKAAQFTPEDHPALPMQLNNLGNALRSRFNQLGNLEDLNSAISLQKKAVQLTPEDSLKLSVYLYSLGNSLKRRFEVLDNVADLTLAEKQLSISVNTVSASPRSRFDSAILWAQCVHLQSSQRAQQPYSQAMALFSEVITLSINITDRYFWLANNAYDIRDAVQNSLQCAQVDIAAEWFEQGQSVVWTQFLQLRSPLKQLRQTYPLLADQLEALSNQLDQASTQDNRLQDIDITKDHIQITNAIGSERKNLLKHIRILPGFTRFLLPKEVADLKRISTIQNPTILINLSQFGCDALLLSSSSVQHIPLTQFDYKSALILYRSLLDILAKKNIKQRSNRAAKFIGPDKVNYDLVFKRILSQLWEEIVKPILKALGIMEPPTELLHITWCLSGLLTFLPLHAAGDYSANCRSGLRLSEFAVSSYIPSMGVLESALQPRIIKSSKLLTVTLPMEGDLPQSRRELEMLSTTLGESEVFELLEENACIANVRKAMEEYSFVHFACHGEQNQVDPTQSALLLSHGTHLTLEDIVKLKLPHAQLAFLSACQTATGDTKLPEEYIHLAAGMLVAGYQSVIAIMWSIQDEDGPIVAKEFYQYLWKDMKPDVRQSAYALHHAVEKLRMQSKSFLQWVPFIHMGV